MQQTNNSLIRQVIFAPRFACNKSTQNPFIIDSENEYRAKSAERNLSAAGRGSVRSLELLLHNNAAGHRLGIHFRLEVCTNFFLLIPFFPSDAIARIYIQNKKMPKHLFLIFCHLITHLSFLPSSSAAQFCWPTHSMLVPGLLSRLVD